MKKTTLFLIIGQAFLLVALSVSSFTYAWFDARSRSVVVDTSAGTIKINSITTDVYKFNYSVYEGSTVIDYDNDKGSVGVTEDVKSTDSIVMNIFDPTLIKISKTNISNLNTNLVLKITLNVTYTTKMNLVLNTVKQIYTGSNFKTSDYVHFTALTSNEYDAYCTSKRYTNDGSATNIFNNIKKYSEDTTTTDGVTTYDHPYTIFSSAQSTSTDTTTTIKDGTNSYYSLKDTKPNTETTGDFTFYINVDYDDNLTNGKLSDSATVNDTYSLYIDSRIGYSFAMDMDYKFAITLNQA